MLESFDTIRRRWQTPTQSTAEPIISDPLRARAIAECDELIAEYQRSERRARHLHKGFRALIIILGAITPLLLLVPEAILVMLLTETYAKLVPLVQALPAAIAAILASLSANFQWREKAEESRTALAILLNEKLKLEFGTKYHPDEFVKVVTELRKCAPPKLDDATDKEQEQPVAAAAAQG